MCLKQQPVACAFASAQSVFLFCAHNLKNKALSEPSSFFVSSSNLKFTIYHIYNFVCELFLTFIVNKVDITFLFSKSYYPVSYTHLRAHETDSYLVCRLLLE